LLQENDVHHTVSVLVENKFGVLARISILFAAREFNVDSLTLSESEDSENSKMTIVVKKDFSVIEQVIKQLNKLMDVIRISNFNDVEYVENGTSLIKIDIKIHAQ
jgi:acetolactate synthase-1/3 small subunit